MYVLQFCLICNKVISHPNDYINHYPSDPFICLGKIIHELSNEGFGTRLPFQELAAAVKLCVNVTFQQTLMSALFSQGRLPEGSAEEEEEEKCRSVLQRQA